MAVVPLRSIFRKKFFFRKNTWTDVVFVADSEYDIYFVFKLSYLVGRGVRTWWSLSEKGFEEKLDVIRFVCVHFIWACSCWIELSDDIRMMMFYFPEVPRNLVSITPCILYDLAELKTKIIWSGRIRNRKKFCRQLFNFLKGKKNIELTWNFFKNISIDSPWREESNDIFFIFRFDRLHQENEVFLKKNAFFYANGRIRKKNDMSGRIRKKLKFN